MRWLAAVVVWLVASCITADLAPCADGRVCPVGLACDDVHHGCVAPEQLTACDGIANLDACTAVSDGRCFDGICLPRGCANGIVEPEELCDDGNTIGGDGCSPDCRSGERCGDGFTDAARGESCDDGNAINRDGCTARCTVEDFVWRLHSGVPNGRRGATAAYDPLRGVVVVFGGLREVGAAVEFLSDTLEWNGQTWSEVLPFALPPGRTDSTMAYDPIRQRMVMFGGQGAIGLLNDTWEWNGASWERIRVEDPIPVARRRQSMAWDPQTRSIVLFGGDNGLGLLRDTWRWDGTRWTVVEYTSEPAARADHALVTDPVRGKVVLIGGTGAAGRIADVWTFEGTQWDPVATSGGWPGDDTIAAGYDPARERIVVRARDGITPVVWELAGTTWSRPTQAAVPDTIHDYASAFDLDRGRFVTFGGALTFDANGFHGVSSTVWEWDGTTWASATVAEQPSPRFGHAIAFDPVRGVTVLYGGSGSQVQGTEPYSDTWEWNGRVWARRDLTGFGPRAFASAVYDEVLGEVVVFGGGNLSGFQTDLWSWNGSTWRLRSTAGPPSRVGAAFAYDTDRDRLVVFGGLIANVISDETWEWDGATWTQRMLSPSPPPRTGTAMAYDPNRKRMVLFGGTNGPPGVAKNDTWEFDGTTWTEITSPTLPEPRGAHSMTFDRARGRVVLGGGVLPEFSQWEWDGARWSQPIATYEPQSLVTFGMVYDEVRREIDVVAGNAILGISGVTWTGSFFGDTDELCFAGIDGDGDGAIGCADADCADACRTCGDLACDAIESDRSCATDCTSTPTCGDAYCGPTEICPGDCPS